MDTAPSRCLVSRECFSGLLLLLWVCAWEQFMNGAPAAPGCACVLGTRQTPALPVGGLVVHLEDGDTELDTFSPG